MNERDTRRRRPHGCFATGRLASRAEPSAVDVDDSALSVHLVAESIRVGNLMPLRIENDPTPKERLTIHAAHKRDRPLGHAGKWLLADFRRRLQS
jgi:hypothetical protein